MGTPLVFPLQIRLWECRPIGISLSVNSLFGTSYRQSHNQHIHSTINVSGRRSCAFRLTYCTKVRVAIWRNDWPGRANAVSGFQLQEVRKK